MSSGRTWTSADNALLRELYPDNPTRAIAMRLGRESGQVYAQASRLGLHKSAAYLASPAAHRLDGVVGQQTRFAKGQQSWNTGRKIGTRGRSAETQFRKGSKPFNAVPVGTERVNSEGYRDRKMFDTGYPPHDWVAVHRLLWIEHNGPIPAGHLLTFRDGDKTNVTLANLELLTRAEHGRRNVMWKRYPRELCEVIQLRGRLNRAINKRSGNEKQD